jgi:hypothetical protein
MDPKACLLMASEAIKARDYEAAQEQLEYYRDWRSGGGFEPKLGARGDDLACLMAHVCLLHGFGLELA